MTNFSTYITGRPDNTKNKFEKGFWWAILYGGEAKRLTSGGMD